MRSRPRAALLLAAALLLSSCPLRLRPPTEVVALDEAFAESRPELAALLENPKPLGKGLAGLLAPPLVLRVALSEGAGKALDAALAEGKKWGKAIPLVASPLIAKAIVQGGSWAGNPPLLVPEWRGGHFPGLVGAASDPIPAYGMAGRAAGSFIAALSKAGGSPSCGLIFAESASRPRSALAAFAEAYAEASEGRPLFVRELVEPDSPTGAGTGGAAEARPGAAPPLSATGAAESAARELLGSDIRLLFVALGPAAGAAIRAATRPGLVIGADFPPAESPSSLAFRIHPDEAGLAGALEADGPGIAAGLSREVPSLIEAGPAQGSARPGGLDFALFLARAVKAGAGGGKRGAESAP